MNYDAFSEWMYVMGYVNDGILTLAVAAHLFNLSIRDEKRQLKSETFSFVASAALVREC